MDRLLALTLRTLALACLVAAAVLLVGGFIEFLVSGRWPDQSLLRLCYDLHLVSARWFLGSRWGLWLHDVLQNLPAAVALLAIAPVCWFMGVRVAAR